MPHLAPPDPAPTVAVPDQGGTPADPADFADALAARLAEALTGAARAAAGPPPLAVGLKTAARMLGIGKTNLETLTAAGKAPAPIRISDGRNVYRTADLAEWVRLGCPDRAEFEARTGCADPVKSRRRTKPR